MSEKSRTVFGRARFTPESNKSPALFVIFLPVGVQVYILAEKSRNVRL